MDVKFNEKLLMIQDLQLIKNIEFVSRAWFRDLPNLLKKIQNI